MRQGMDNAMRIPAQDGSECAVEYHYMRFAALAQYT